MVDETVDGRERHGWIREDLAPFAEGLVGRDQDRAPFVARADEFEEDARLGLVLGNVGEVVEDQEVEAVEPVDGGFEGELAAGNLELLDEVGGSGEEDLPAVLDEGEADRRGEVALAATGRTGVIMPGVRLSKPGSRIRSTLATVS